MNLEVLTPRTGRLACPRGHGRAATFSAFMVEKGFARHLTRPEIEDGAQRAGIIRCASCGAPSDAAAGADLWAAGLEMVWRLLTR